MERPEVRKTRSGDGKTGSREEKPMITTLKKAGMYERYMLTESEASPPTLRPEPVASDPSPALRQAQDGDGTAIHISSFKSFISSKS